MRLQERGLYIGRCLTMAYLSNKFRSSKGYRQTTTRYTYYINADTGHLPFPIPARIFGEVSCRLATTSRTGSSLPFRVPASSQTSSTFWLGPSAEWPCNHRNHHYHELLPIRRRIPSHQTLEVVTPDERVQSCLGED